MIKSVIAPPEKSNQLQMSYEEYLVWANAREGRSEWVNGEVIIHMSVKPIHQKIIKFLLVLIELFARLHRLGEVTTAPVAVKLDPHTSREPDIFFVANDQLTQLTEDRFEGAPALAIEVISGESVRRDRETKYKEYRDAGVQEYWIIDPREGKQRADFYRLNENSYLEK
ncbi:MAG: Uma2 family endonuclease [Chloroflexota bacterium]